MGRVRYEEGANNRLGMCRILYKTSYPFGMGGNEEGKKWIIIIWIWVWTRVDLSIPSPVASLVGGNARISESMGSIGGVVAATGKCSMLGAMNKGGAWTCWMRWLFIRNTQTVFLKKKTIHSKHKRFFLKTIYRCISHVHTKLQIQISVPLKICKRQRKDKIWTQLQYMTEEFLHPFCIHPHEVYSRWYQIIISTLLCSTNNSENCRTGK
jgi:hypothetical protein